MHEARLNKKSSPEAFRPKDIFDLLHKPECIVTTNPDSSFLISIITWHFQSHLVNVSILLLKYEYVLEEKRAVSHATPIVTSRGVF